MGGGGREVTCPFFLIVEKYSHWGSLVVLDSVVAQVQTNTKNKCGETNLTDAMNGAVDLLCFVPVFSSSLPVRIEWR